MGRSRSPIFMVETQLGQAGHEEMLQWMATRGFGVLGEPAAESAKGGTYGGTLLLFPAHTHFHFAQKQIVEGCGWYGVTWTFDNFDVVMIMAYFKCGEGIQSQTNALLWSGLLTFVTGLQKQVIIMGDFNITPEEFMTTTMAQIMQVQVLQ